MSSLLYAFGRLAHRRWKVVLLVWVLVLGAGGTAALTLSEGTTNSFSIPGTESQEALDRLAATFPQVSGSSAQVVAVAADGDVRDETGSVTEVVEALEALDDVAAVSPVLAEDGTLLPDAQVSADGDTLLLTAQLDVGRDEVTEDVTDALLGVVDDASTDAVTWTAGGDAFQAETVALGATELVGLLVAGVVLTLTLGSLLAAGMPLVTAVVGVALAMSLVFAATVGRRAVEHRAAARRHDRHRRRHRLRPVRARPAPRAARRGPGPRGVDRAGRRHGRVRGRLRRASR